MKILARVIIVITIFYFGFFYGQSLTRTNNNILENNQENTCAINKVEELFSSLMIDFGDGTLKTFNNIEINNETNVFDLLKNTLSKNEIDLEFKDYGGELGAMVESINGIKNNMTEMEYWQYWVNNEYAKVGASIQKVNNHDVVMWKLIKGQFNE